MDQVRIVMQGPIEGQTWVVAVPPTSVAIDLTQFALSDLAAKIRIGAQIVSTFEGATSLCYRWATQTGIVSETALSTATATSQQVGGIKFPNQNPVQPETPVVNTTFLIAKSIGGTGILRLWTAGG